MFGVYPEDIQWYIGWIVFGWVGLKLGISRAEYTVFGVMVRLERSVNAGNIGIMVFTLYIVVGSGLIMLD